MKALLLQNNTTLLFPRRVAFGFYKISILLLPLSYGVKYILGFAGESVLWIDPSLIIGIFSSFFLFLNPLDKKFLSNRLFILIFIFWAFYLFSGILNALFLSEDSFFIAVRESVRVLLGINYLIISYFFSREKKDRIQIYKYFGLAACLQLLFALYLLASTIVNVPILASAKSYAINYLIRQTTIFIIPIPRLGGTFYESPPFGLYMLVALYTSFLFYKETKSKWAIFFMLISLVGALGSFADQVLLGLFLSLAISVGFDQAFKKSYLRPIFLVFISAFLITAFFLIIIPSLIAKYEAIQYGSMGGASIGERAFHITNSLEMFAENVLSILIGIGPGFYGLYASQLAEFSDKVTIQVTPVEILVESGIIGITLFGMILYELFQIIRRQHGILGIAIFSGLLVANSLQANWKWISVFFICGFLCGFSSLKEEKQNS